MPEIERMSREVNRNKLALVLSVIPGLGHLYKRHYVSGLGILIAGNVLVAFAAAWLAIATLGVALVALPVLWVAGVGWSAYLLPDRHPRAVATPEPRMSEEGHLVDPAVEQQRRDF